MLFKIKSAQLRLRRSDGVKGCGKVRGSDYSASSHYYNHSLCWQATVAPYANPSTFTIFTPYFWSSPFWLRVCRNGRTSGTATGCASTWKKDFKKPISISVCPPKLPVPHAHLLHNPVISPSDSKLSHTKLLVIRRLRGSYEFNECHQDLNDKFSWQAILLLQNRKNF